MGSDGAGLRGRSGKPHAKSSSTPRQGVSHSPAEKGTIKGKGNAIMHSSPRAGQGSRKGKGLFPSPEESQGKHEGKGNQGKGKAMTT